MKKMRPQVPFCKKIGQIGITMGDPSGIGPEVTLKALAILGHPQEVRPSRQVGISAPDTFCVGTGSPQQDTVIIGSRNIIEETKNRYNIKWDGEVIDCVDVKREDIGYGKVSELAGRAAYQSILTGYKLVSSKIISALVTAPINKASVNLVCPFPPGSPPEPPPKRDKRDFASSTFSGHTELLASLSGTKRFAMLLMGDTLRVTLVTTHIPLKEVARKLNVASIVSKIELTADFLTQNLGIISPLIGVCALNPHGGEGIFGIEESEIILPAIEEAKSKGINVKGPYPADTLFVPQKTEVRKQKSENRSQKFDAIIAMYHDQGMIPIKIREFGNAVNITLGLPFMRTSPDHGTAFNIAGKGVANPISMIKAIRVAQRLGSLKVQKSKSS